MTKSTPGSGPGLVERAEILFSLALVGLLGLLVLPVSTHFLDLLIALNMAGALAILLLASNIRRAIDFSAFPTLLLFVTLFRLALHVSSTRQILTHGPGFDGMMIQSFGNFVAGESAIVGLVVFSLLMLIQYLVITKGAERVAEVSARFQLDALPVRLMSLESAVNQGLSPQSAEQMRADIQLEADFYGAMDGASRFVKGENLASLVIVMVNIVGGLVMAFGREGASFSSAASAAVLLTIGDGLVNLVPSLVISLAMGLVVTKTARSSKLSADLVSQMIQEPWILALAAGSLSILLLFFSVGGGTFSGWALAGAAVMGAMSWRMRQWTVAPRPGESRMDVSSGAGSSSAAPSTSVPCPAQSIMGFLMAPALEIQVGSWIPAGMSGDGATLESVLEGVRTECARDLGLYVPAIQMRPCPSLEAGACVVMLRGVEIGRTRIPVGHVLRFGPGSDQLGGEPLCGFDPRDRVDRAQPARWIRPEQMAEASGIGQRIVGPGDYLGRYLVSALTAHADAVLGLEELKVILDGLRQNSPAVAEEIGSGRLPQSTVHGVLCLLLREGISIRNLAVIVQALAAQFGRMGDDPEALLPGVRLALGMQICRGLADATGWIRVMMLDPAKEHELLSRMDTAGAVAIEADEAREILGELTAGAEKMRTAGDRPVLAVDGRLRLGLVKLVGRYLPDVTMIGVAELGRDFKMKAVFRVCGPKRKARTA